MFAKRRTQHNNFGKSQLTFNNSKKAFYVTQMDLIKIVLIPPDQTSLNLMNEKQKRSFQG